MLVNCPGVNCRDADCPTGEFADGELSCHRRKCHFCGIRFGPNCPPCLYLGGPAAHLLPVLPKCRISRGRVVDTVDLFWTCREGPRRTMLMIFWRRTAFHAGGPKPGNSCEFCRAIIHLSDAFTISQTQFRQLPLSAQRNRTTALLRNYPYYPAPATTALLRASALECCATEPQLPLLRFAWRVAFDSNGTALLVLFSSSFNAKFPPQFHVLRSRVFTIACCGRKRSFDEESVA